MKHTFLLSALTLLLAGTGSAAWAQQVYRCVGAGGAAPEYINNTKEAQQRNCKLVSGGNVTVVQTSPAVRAATATPTAPVRVAAGGPVSSDPVQRARDSDSRAILEAELKKAEAKLAEQQKEYNNGEPDKQGIEGRNHQRYLDRVAELKDNITRNQSDIAGLKREISRLPAPTSTN
ncbi:hypothetical protein SAMN05216350_10725 [Polaromonas sp. YR568]|uniref:hypothetical protein n=1 Tax=Polaromonas sp. YR568 TaxID=1855301 RepID=UPI0008E913F3|nr:hypothetical protein [Polaromonas sp. YR568]SFU87817.1 hypothetical protein SAMN05216350_10725 [Polaromonas sp. YR568]